MTKNSNRNIQKIIQNGQKYEIMITGKMVADRVQSMIVVKSAEFDIYNDQVNTTNLQQSLVVEV